MVNQAVSDGFFATSAQIYGRADVAREETQVAGFLEAMVEIKKQLTRKLR